MAAPTRTATGFALLTAILIFITPFLATRSVAQTTTPYLSSAPEAIDLTVALGTTATTSLQIRNDSGDPVTPRLYEAFQPDPQPATTTGSAEPRAQPDSAIGDGPAIDPQIAAIQAADPRGEATFLVFLDSQADLSAAYGMASWAERGRYVDATLRAYAESSQRDLRAALQARGLAYTPLWIVNGLAVRGDTADVGVIAAQAHVAELRVARVAELEAPPPSTPAQASSTTCAAGADNVCWNIARVGAGRAWDEFGVDGEGITVANIDSGVRFNHPALVGQYRGNEPSGVRHDYNWYDPYGDQPAPVDAGNHGTHTMGTMVARGLSSTQPAVGMAPGASWMAVRACSARECNELDLILAAQWLLAPTDLAGNNPRPDLRPHVISNSWTSGQNATWYTGYVAAWRAAGMYPVFAAGNGGNLSGCGSIQSPGDYAGVTAVGATDSADRLTSFSSIGPTTDGRIKPDLTAPGLGVYSTVADERVYGSSSGTSMATPHVAGAVALLWSASPTLIGNYAATYAALTGAATPMIGDSRFLGPSYSDCRPTATPNSIYGYGRLDVYRALADASVDVPWIELPGDPPAAIAPASSSELRLSLDTRKVPGPGVYQARVLIHGPDLARPPALVPITLRVPADPSHAVIRGQVTRAADGAPLAATVQVAGGAAVRADSQGRYSLTLPARTEPYSLSATARSHREVTATAALEPGDQLTLDFRLEADQPRLTADMTPQTVDLDFGQRETVLLSVGNLGSQPLSYTISLPVERYGIWRSDEADGPAAMWTEPPPEATTVPLTDDGTSGPLPIGFGFPFYHSSYDQFAISANGVIMLQPPPAGTISFTRVCLPLAETPGPAIAPLRVDLDPSQPDARVSYAHLSNGLLVSWENVPLFNDPSQRFSFQALLTPDGRISMRYRTVGAIAPSEVASLGLQHNTAEVQTLGCKTNLPIADGLTLELRPQVPASLWLSLGATQGSVAPGAEVSVPVTVSWVSPYPFSNPRSGIVELRSNDPAAPLTRFSVRLWTTAAPYTTRLLQVYAP